jgi:catechol 2,3-dioxygenase-like lactoylglutathione lyase family enzyme
MNINSFAAVLTVSNLDASLQYYVDVLGFREEFRFGNYAGLIRDECRIHLSQQGNPNSGTPGTGAVYIFCDEVDAYFALISSRGARVDGEPKDYPYGLRDFIARDPDGNMLTFSVPVLNKPSQG